MSGHPIVHVEIPSTNLDETGNFYKDLFGWSAKPVWEYEYMLFNTNAGGLQGGYVKIDDDTYKAGDVILYVATDDIGATLAKVESLGGKTLLPETEIPGTGWFAFFSDPAGNRLGLFKGL
jgi:uncharacterized protein